jgi:hypothetical protein
MVQVEHPIPKEFSPNLCYDPENNMDNLSNKRDFGPFTPQELERFVAWLQDKKLVFEIVKDQAAENAFTINDGQNAVFRADLRTEVYLAQIFTVRVENLTTEQVGQINTDFKLLEEVPARFKTDEKVIPFESDTELKTRLKQSSRQKQQWAVIIFILMVIPLLFGLIKNILE